MRKLINQLSLMRIHIPATLLFTSEYETLLHIILLLLADNGRGKHICFFGLFQW